jgi:hypothetical protein
VTTLYLAQPFSFRLAAFKLKFLFTALITSILCCCMVLTFPLQATALDATPNQFFSLGDLPREFEVASEAEAESCQMAGEKSAFVLKQQAQLVELICVASFSLAARAENAAQVEMVQQVYDAILQNPQALVEQAQSMGVEGVQTLTQLQDIGEVATGFSKIEAGIGQTEVALFRRGDMINSVLVRYATGQEPLIPLKTVARKLDRRVADYLTASASTPTALEKTPDLE